jgi:hypothetical protein
MLPVLTPGKHKDPAAVIDLAIDYSETEEDDNALKDLNSLIQFLADLEDSSKRAALAFEVRKAIFSKSFAFDQRVSAFEQ